MLLIAYGCFLVNMLFGLLVKSRIIDTSRIRSLHHGIYAVVMASLIATIVLRMLTGSIPFFLIGMALLLLGMPSFRGRSKWHWIYATFCFLVYSLLLVTDRG